MKIHSVARSALLLLAIGVGAGLLPAVPPVQAGPSAREIMDKVALTRKLDGSEAVIKMRILNEKGQARERKISMATKLFEGGKTEKRIYRFLSPADVEGCYRNLKQVAIIILSNTIYFLFDANNRRIL